MKNLFYECAYEIKYETIGNDVNYAFVEKGETLFIYFQGSSSFTDWVENFNFFHIVFKRKAYGEFKVHRGFLKCYNQVRNLILDKIYNNNYKEIVVVGYSHGGALCTLAIEDIVYHFPKLNVKGFAFESPRVVKVPNELKSRWGSLVVVRCNNDLITHLPPKLFGFDDVGEMIKISGDTELVKNRMPKCIKSHYPECVMNGLDHIA